MTAGFSPSGGTVSPLVRVSATAEGQFTAQVVGLPELQATAPTREKAIEQVRTALASWTAAEELISLEVPAGNSLLRWFGWAKDDPEYDAFREELRRQREALDEGADQEADRRSSTRDMPRLASG